MTELRDFASADAGTENDSSANEAAFSDQSLTRQRYIYFIRVGLDGPVKIGSATNVQARLVTLQTGNHETLYLIGTMPCESIYDEHNLHRKFRKHHIRGEWFLPARLILLLAKGYKPRGGTDHVNQ